MKSIRVILSIARKTLLENWREPQLIALFMLFPLALVFIYFIAFGPSSGGMAHFLQILVLNQDDGSRGQDLIDDIRAAQFDGSPVFSVSEIGAESSARTVLLENKAAALVVIPPDFSRKMEAARLTNRSDPASLFYPARIRLVGDPASDLYVFSKSFLNSIFEEYAGRVTGWATPFDLRYEFVEGTGTMSDFQFGVPGIIVFGVIFGIISSAMLLVREDVGGTLRRLKLSQANGFHLLGGITLATMAESAVQAPLTFAAALLMGFRSPGSLLLALAVTLTLSLAACGMGYLAACFAKNDGEAANVGSMLMIPLVFLSGAMFPVPPVNLGSIAGRSVSLYDIFPTTHAVEALRRILIYGDGAGAVAFELAATLGLSLLYLWVGVWFYQRIRLRNG